MKKYNIWQDNGTGYLDCVGTVEAVNKKQARDAATSSFAMRPSSIVVASPGVDPNTWGPSGNRHPDHREHARESMRRKRQARDAAAVMFGFASNGEAIAAIFDALSSESQLIRLATPLPCGVRMCDNMATGAHAYQVQSRSVPGLWIVQPICQSCNEAMLALYEKGDE